MMARAGGGAICNTASVVALTGPRSTCAYAGSKHGVLAASCESTAWRVGDRSAWMLALTTARLRMKPWRGASCFPALPKLDLNHVVGPAIASARYAAQRLELLMVNAVARNESVRAMNFHYLSDHKRCLRCFVPK